MEISTQLPKSIEIIEEVVEYFHQETTIKVEKVNSVFPAMTGIPHMTVLQPCQIKEYPGRILLIIVKKP